MKTELSTPERRRTHDSRKATLHWSLSRDRRKLCAVEDPEHVRKHLVREPGEPGFARCPAGTAGRIGKSQDAIR